MIRGLKRKPAIAATVIPGIGRAVDCSVAPAGTHRPVPVRFVWHHIQPHEAGGATDAANLVQLCDNCHYTIHRLLWNMAKGLPQPPCRAAQLAYAQRGYDACVAAGTVARIPNEGLNV